MFRSDSNPSRARIPQLNPNPEQAQKHLGLIDTDSPDDLDSDSSDKAKASAKTTTAMGITLGTKPPWVLQTLAYHHC